jgi:hypothetical protein
MNKQSQETLGTMKFFYIAGAIVAVVILVGDAGQTSNSKSGYAGFALAFLLWGWLILSSTYLALTKGRELVEGVVLGAFGPLGFIIEVLLPPVPKTNPQVELPSKPPGEASQ